MEGGMLARKPQETTSTPSRASSQGLHWQFQIPITDKRQAKDEYKNHIKSPIRARCSGPVKANGASSFSPDSLIWIKYSNVLGLGYKIVTNNECLCSFSWLHPFPFKRALFSILWTHTLASSKHCKLFKTSKTKCKRAAPCCPVTLVLRNQSDQG